MKPYYQDDRAGIVIYHADCRDVLPTLEAGSVDLVLTDPPYGVSGQQNTRTCRRRGGPKNRYSLFADSVEYVRAVAVPVITRLVESGLRVVITPGNRCLTLYPMPDSFGAIFQPASVGLQPWGRADAQPILYYGRSPHGGRELPSQSCSYTLLEAPPANGHPCPKPLIFWRTLLSRISLPGELVLDPFMGSGTTAIAALRLRRKFRGIEIDSKWVAIGTKRLREELENNLEIDALRSTQR